MNAARFAPSIFVAFALLTLGGCISTFQAGCTRTPQGGYECNGGYTPTLPAPPVGERG